MRIVMNRRRFLGAAAAGLAVGAMPGFVRRAGADTPLTFQASWINDAEFTGYFVAIDKGFYKAEGLDLTYLLGRSRRHPGELADRRQGRPDADHARHHRFQAITEQGAKFKIIGAQYQKNPIGIVSLAKNPINEPDDLSARRWPCRRSTSSRSRRC